MAGGTRRIPDDVRRHRIGFRDDRDQAIGVAFLIQSQQIIPVTLIGIAMAPEFIFKKRRPVGEDRPDAEVPNDEQ